MVARNRSMVQVRTSGARWANNNPGVQIGAGSFATETFACSDVTGVGDCAPFTVNSRQTTGGIINKYTNAAFASQFRNYLADWLRNTANGPHISVSGVPSNVEMSTLTAARTNPSRPYVDVPVNILDVRTRVDQIRLDVLAFRKRFPRPPRKPRHGDVTSATGQAWLQYQFMIRPLVGDIVKLCKAQDQISRRITEINKLYDGQGIRRTIDIGVYSAQSTSNQTVQSAGTFISKSFAVNTRVGCRCHIRWKPATRCGLKPAPDVISAWAKKAVYGLTIDFSTLWEIAPWSWLIDWFGNVGTYLSANRNIIPAQVVGVYPMTHTKTTWECSGVNGTDPGMTPIRVLRETKSRSVSFVAPIAHLPFLNSGQMGILSALVAARV